ncbi:MAG: glycosyltransferase family A protein [Pseudomonadota bacterium]|nr:glycosyltransferase family A protein [Pseudomonadota bacterium]
MNEWRETRAELALVKKETAPVSVIIPCYRAASTIARALNSVAAQSYRPYEVIIVDDASDDETPKVLSLLLKEYGESWLKLFFLESNQGPATARNYGWEQASRPWIAFLDADDTWHADKLALQSGFMESHPEIGLSGHLCGASQILVSGLPTRFRISECSLSGLLYSNSLRTPTVVLRRDIALRFPEDRRYGEDYHLWLSFLGAGGRAAFLNLPLAATHKPAFGVSGQSAALWRMEKGELAALFAVWYREQISLAKFVWVAGWSLFKFIRRLLITGFR